MAIVLLTVLLLAVWVLVVLSSCFYRQDLYLYRLLPHIRGSANANITCLWRSISRLIEEGRVTKDQTLYIQMDGGSENANQTLLRFAAWLCQKGIFRTVSG